MPKINTADSFPVFLTSQADTKLNQINPTLAAGDVKVSIDGGAFANLATLPVVTPAGSDQVIVSVSAAETNGSFYTVRFTDVAGAEWCTRSYTVFTSPDTLTVNNIADGLLDRADGIETGLTPRQAQRLVAAIVCGTSSGGGTTTLTFKNAGGSTTRAVFTVTSVGNRSAATLTP